MEQIMYFAADKLYLVIVIASVLYLGFFHWREFKAILISALFIGGVSLLLSTVATALISNPRPFVAENFLPPIPSFSNNGFPSGHTLLLAALGCVVFLRQWFWGLLVELGALCVGLARVWSSVHHWQDVVGSFVIVGISLLLYQLVLRQFINKSSPRGKP